MKIKIVKKPDFIKRKDHLYKLTQETINKVTTLGKVLGFKSMRKWRIPNAELDLVWYVDVPFKFSLFAKYDNKCPVAAFEIETSGRTEKHLKGDIVNLILFPTFLSVIILLKEGYNTRDTTITYKGNKKTVEQLSKVLTGGKVQVWDIEDIDKLLKEKP